MTIATEQTFEWLPNEALLRRSDPRVDRYVLEPRFQTDDPVWCIPLESVPDPYDVLGALCIDVLPTARSLIPYAKKLSDVGGPSRQKVLLLPASLSRSAFLRELTLLGAFDIGARDLMLTALAEGACQVQQDVERPGSP